MANVKTVKTGIVLDPQSSDPSGAVEGQVQFSDGTAQTKGLLQYKDGAWAAIGGGGAGAPTTIHLIKANTDSDTDFTIKSIDEVLPDFDATDTLGATFSVPSSGSEALLSNDDDHAVYKFATTTSTVYDAVGRSFTMPRYARGRDILLEFQYRTADTSGASANGDYMVWIVDDTNMVNTTTTSTGAQAAGTSLVVGTSTGMSVGDKIWIGETGGTTQVTEAHITAIADSTHVTLSEAVNLTSGDRFVTGVLSDVLTTLNAADSDTDLEGASFKKYVQVPTTCATIKFLVQQLTTETDSFLYFDNILIDSDPFKKVETQGVSEFIRLHTGNGHGSTNTTIRRFTTEVENEGTNLFTYSDSSTLGMSITFLRDCNIEVSYADEFGANNSIGLSLNSSQLTTNIATITTADRLIMSQTGAANSTEAVPWDGKVSKGDVLRVHTDGSAVGSSQARVSFTMLATPQKGTAIIVESADSVMSDLKEYTPIFTGFGTATNVDIFSQRDGDHLIVTGSFTTGTPTAVEARISLGYNGSEGGLIIDSGKVGSIKRVGDWTGASTTSTVDTATLGEPSVSYLTFGFNITTTAGLTKQNGSGAFAASTKYSINARVPIAGWSAVNKPLLAIPTITVGQNAEDYRADGHAGYGSTNTKIPYFTNATQNTISNLGTITNDSTSGFAFTATSRCKVHLSYDAISSGASAIGISLNSNQLTTSISTITAGDRVIEAIADVGWSEEVSASVLMDAGDVLRPHTDGATAGTVARWHISLLVEPELGQQNHAAIISAPVAFVEDRKAQGVSGGSSSATAVARTLNTLSGDIAAVAVELDGTDGFKFTEDVKIEFEWETPFYNAVGLSKSMLYNETTSKALAFTNVGNGTTSVGGSVKGRYVGVIKAGDVLAIHQESQTGSVADGLGRSDGGVLTDLSGKAGYYELYTTVKITRKS